MTEDKRVARIRRAEAKRRQASGYEGELRRRPTSNASPPAEGNRKPFFADPATVYVAIAAALGGWLVVWLTRAR